MYSTLVRNIGPVLSKSGLLNRTTELQTGHYYIAVRSLIIFKPPAQEDLIRGGIEELQPELSEVGYVEKVGDMIPGTQVFKTGRTGGLTFGKVHSLYPRF